MRLLAIDTSSAATVVVAADGERRAARRHDPRAGERPQHTRASLALAAEALAELGLGWSDLQRVGVGVGPGSFTGLRAGLSAAAGVARAQGVGLVPLAATELLARGAGSGGPLLAVIDGRRRELFCERFGGDGRGGGVLRLARDRLDPLGDLRGCLAVGDGALLAADALRALGASVPEPGPGGAPHRIEAAALAALTAAGEPQHPDAVRPAYGREPDAVPTAQREAVR